MEWTELLKGEALSPDPREIRATPDDAFAGHFRT
jgi:hypothetical protein